MPRIPQAELDRLKSEVSLERLVEAYGVKLKRKGKDLHGLCPFHEEKTASFIVSPEKNLWNCKGACQEGGDVIKWVQKAEGVSFTHAVELLRGDTLPLAAASSPRPVLKRATVRKLSPLADSSVEDQELLARVVSYYQKTLKATPKALEYLQGRGLTNSELIDHFQLGFCNRTLCFKLPESSRKEGKELREKLKGYGILRKSGHEHFRGSVVVPLFDAEGKFVQMYGRKITGNLRSGTPDHLYLPGPQRGVFNLEGILASEEVILCESLIDALTFWSAGFRNVTTAYGAGGLNQDLWEAFEKAGTRRVLIAFDRDKAGDAGAKKLAKQLNEKGIAAYRIQFPFGLDANEYAAKVTPAAQSLGVVIRSAHWMGEGVEPEREREEPVASSVEESSAAKGEGAEGPDPEPALPATAKSPTPEGPLSPHRIPPVPEILALEEVGADHFVTLGDRRYRVRDLGKNTSGSLLKVNLFVSREAAPQPLAGFHMDSLDLCKDRDRSGFSKRAGQELGVEASAITRDLGKLLLTLEVERDRLIEAKLKPKEETVEISDKDRLEAMALLNDPNLFEIILKDFERSGIVGEEENKLVAYLAASSRKLPHPLAVVIQSNSAAGKSMLMDGVLAFMPEEECVVYSAMTGQSLFYIGDTVDLKQKILGISEEEGAQKASYALKLLQSEGKISIASPSKDQQGTMGTKIYKVEGPVMVFLTTTAIDTDEELLNRCLILTVDEGREQTRAIHKLQRDRQTLAGLLETKQKAGILRRHQNAQRLLRPLLVANPYARELTFLDHQTRMRRDHMKYLTLIKTVAFVHQYQREVKRATTDAGDQIEYIEVTKADIVLANRLAQEVLGRSFDEVPPQTRKLLTSILQMVEVRCQEQGITREEYRFTRREVRDWSGVGNSQAQIHLSRLEELEYLLVHSGGRGQRMVYELLYEEPEAGSMSIFPGLLKVEEAGSATESSRYDPNLPGSDRQLPGSNRGQTGGVPGSYRGTPKGSKTLSTKDFKRASKEENPLSFKNARKGDKNSAPAGEVVAADHG